MTISQLIAELQAIYDTHGDLGVAHECDWNGPQGRWDDYYVHKVEFMPEYTDDSGYHEPPHVLLTGEDTPVRDNDPDDDEAEEDS